MFLDLIIAVLFRNNVVAGKNTVSIGINHKNGFAACIKKYGISSLRANAFYCQDLFSEAIQIQGKQLIQ